MKTTVWSITFVILLILGITLYVKNRTTESTEPVTPAETLSQTLIESTKETEDTIDVQYTLQTIAEGGKLLFQGVGGEIDEVINPDLIAPQGAVVKIILINADGMPHNIFLPDFDSESSYVAKIGEQTEIVFDTGTSQPGSYVYYCEVPGHRQAGQEGKLFVTKP